MFKEHSSGIRTPNFGKMKRKHLILVNSGYIKMKFMETFESTKIGALKRLTRSSIFV